MTTPTKPHTGMRVSVAEFLELELPEPDDKLKMELDDGALYIMPRPRAGHLFVQGELQHHFKLYRDGFAEPPLEAWYDLTISVPSELPRLFVPDLTIILRGGATVDMERMIVAGIPDIVVEVLSSDPNRDLVRKRQVYAEAGIPEYWIFDWRAGTALLLELRDGVYVERAMLSVGDTLTTPLLPGLAIPLSSIFRHRRPPAG